MVLEKLRNLHPDQQGAESDYDILPPFPNSATPYENLGPI